MPAPSVEVLRGTLDLLTLKAVSWGPTHGYGVARWIEQATNDVLQIEEGSLYPALHRLETRGWIDAAWGTSDNNSPAKRPRPGPDSRRPCSRRSRRPPSRRRSDDTARACVAPLSPLLGQKRAR